MRKLGEGVLVMKAGKKKERGSKYVRMCESARKRLKQQSARGISRRPWREANEEQRGRWRERRKRGTGSESKAKPEQRGIRGCVPRGAHANTRLVNDEIVKADRVRHDQILLDVDELVGRARAQLAHLRPNGPGMMVTILGITPRGW
eukprot:6201720-Pleurochrysis_carterae.AAC.2